MKGFSLPPLNESFNENKESKPPVDEVIEDVKETEDIEDASIDEVEEDFESISFEGDETNSSSSFFIEGEVKRIMKDEDKQLVVYKIETGNDIVLIRDDDINLQVSEGDIIQAKVDEDDSITTDGGAKAYEAYFVDITKHKVDEDFVVNDVTVSDSSLQSKQGKGDGRFSFKESIKAAIAAVKEESLQSKNFDDDNDFEDDYYADNYEDEDKNEKGNNNDGGRGKRSNNRGNPFKWLINLYKKIAMIIFNVIMKPIKWLSDIPIIGFIFKLVDKLSGVIKFIAYLWLPILIFILIGMGKLVLPSADTPKDIVENVTSTGKDAVESGKDKLNNDKNEEKTKNKKDKKDKGAADLSKNEPNNEPAKIDVNVGELKTGKTPTIELSNDGNVYADVYADITLNKKGMFSKSNKCTTETTLIPPKSKKSVTIKCDNPIESSKIKKFDIISEYKK